MRLYLHDGRPHAALDTCTQLEQRLQALRARPGRATQFLRQTIQHDFSASSPWLTGFS